MPLSERKIKRRDRRGELLLLSTPVSCAFWKTWKIVKPNPIKDSEGESRTSACGPRHSRALE